MIPKEKAKELYRMFRGFNSESEEMNHNTAIQCAELCIDEMLKYAHIKALSFLREVKQEIEKI